MSHSHLKNPDFREVKKDVCFKTDEVWCTKLGRQNEPGVRVQTSTPLFHRGFHNVSDTHHWTAHCLCAPAVWPIYLQCASWCSVKSSCLSQKSEYRRDSFLAVPPTTNSRYLILPLEYLYCLFPMTQPHNNCPGAGLNFFLQEYPRSFPTGPSTSRFTTSNWITAWPTTETYPCPVSAHLCS